MAVKTTTDDKVIQDEEFIISSISSKREILDAARAKELLLALFRAGENDITVKKVSLSGKSFSPEAARVACEALKGVVKDLHELDISDIIAGQPEEAAKEALGEICSAFGEAKDLEWLDVSDNALGRKGVSRMEPLLSRQTKLKHVYFCNNGLAADAAELLIKFLADSGKLETFHFHNNLLESAGAEVLSKLIKGLNHLKSFRFSTTRGTSLGIAALSKALSTCAESLTELEFTDNTVTPEGAKAVADLIRSTSKLNALRLRDCSLDDEGVVAILSAAAEESDCAIKILDISGNDITEDGANDVAEHLTALKKLERVWMEDNELGEGAYVLTQALSGAPLKQIDLSCCEIGTQTGCKIVKLLRKQSSVEKVGLNGNMLSGVFVKQVQGIFEDRLGDMSDNDSDGEEFELDKADDEENLQNSDKKELHTKKGRENAGDKEIAEVTKMLDEKLSL